MTQNKSQQGQSVPSLCPICQKMFGHSSFQGMCSLCFKKQKGQQQVQIVKDKLEKVQTEKIVRQAQITVDEQNFKRPRPVEQPPIIGKCQVCKKKVGILGYNCKHCQAPFCKLHRLPEDHQCGVDFISLGRKKLKQQNPTVGKGKIQKF